MHKLIVLRHAKAVSPYDAPDDHQRGLTPRGRADASRMGAELDARGWRPSRVIGSDASRVVQTWAAARSSLGAPDVLWRPELYLAEANQWAGQVHDVLAVATEPQTLLIIGHNPGLHGFAMAADRSLGGTPGEDGLRLIEKLPTCGAVLFDMMPGPAPKDDRFRIRAFITPRDLPEGDPA